MNPASEKMLSWKKEFWISKVVEIARRKTILELDLD